MSVFTGRRSEGQALVEFAIVLPVLVLLVLALFDAGRGVLYYSEIANASRVAARVAIVNQSDDESCAGPDRTFKCAAADIAVATGVAASSIDDLVVTTVSGSDCSLPSNCTATVKVDFSFEPITPVIGTIFGDVDLSASTTMPLERVYNSSVAP
jgi:Flp pilus assembly protein TadG